VGFKLASKLLLKQQETDDQGTPERIEKLQKQVEAGDRIDTTFERIHPPFLHGAITLFIAMAIEFHLKAILTAICPMKFVTDDGLDEMKDLRITTFEN